MRSSMGRRLDNMVSERRDKTKETQTTVGQSPIGGYLSSRPLQASRIDQANLR